MASGRKTWLALGSSALWRSASAATVVGLSSSDASASATIKVTWSMCGSAETSASAASMVAWPGCDEAIAVATGFSDCPLWRLGAGSAECVREPVASMLAVASRLPSCIAGLPGSASDMAAAPAFASATAWCCLVLWVLRECSSRCFRHL